MANQSRAFLGDEAVVSTRPFQLSYSPRHVVNHVTKDVKLRCAHDGHNHSKLGDIARIRLLKKSVESSSWQLMAEHREHADQPTTKLGIQVSGKIDHESIGETFLEVMWPMTVEDTFGTYRCDVIGYLRDSEVMVSEMSRQLDITAEGVTAADMLLLFGQVSNEVSSVRNIALELSDNLISLNENFVSIDNDIDIQGKRRASLSTQIDEIADLADTTKVETEASQSYLESLGLDVESINDTLTTATDEMVVLEREATSMEGEINSVQGDVETLNTDIVTCKTETSSLKKNILMVQTQVGTVTEEVSSAKLTLDSSDLDLNSELTDLKSETERLSEKMRTLGTKFQSVIEEVSSLAVSFNDYKKSKDIIDEIHSWPEGQFSLLQPVTGCPLDLTFSDQADRYYQIHIESKSDHHHDRVPDFLGHYAEHTEGKNRFMTLWFCEANGILNTRPWPSGSYCIHKIFRVPCPPGFHDGHLVVDQEDVDPVYDYTSRSVADNNFLLACCRDDIQTQPLVFPTGKPFVLYQNSDECPDVEGMEVENGSIYLDYVRIGNDNDQRYDTTKPESSHTVIFEMFLCFYK